MKKFQHSIMVFTSGLLLLGSTSAAFAAELNERAQQSTTIATVTLTARIGDEKQDNSPGNHNADILAAATPQPPLIDKSEDPNYEPPMPIDHDDKNAGEEKPLDTKDERLIGNTPQPPLVDHHEEPRYGPKETGKTQNETAEQVTDDHAETDGQAAVESAGDSKGTSADKQTDEQSDEIDDTPEDSSGDNLTDSEAQTGAEKKAELAEKQAEEKKKEWTETYPVSVNADWLQLKSGEWLRGRIIVLQKDNLEFDSDELDDLVIEWKNVKYLKSYEPYSLRFDSKGRTAVTGTIEVIGDKVHVKTDYDDKTYDRSDLNTIASGKETEISYWKSKVTFSINLRKGNTDQTDFTSKITAKRRTTVSRLILDYLGNFTKVQETETINNHRFNETYDYFITRNLYWTPLFAEIYRDPFQNIERRINAGVGIGYSLINTPRAEWNIAGGPAYQETLFVSVQSDTNKDDKTIALMLRTSFDTEINDKVDIEGLYSITLGDQETGGYTHHSLLTIETELTNKLDLDITGVWDYVRTPVTDKDGATPAQDDFRLMIGLGYDL